MSPPSAESRLVSPETPWHARWSVPRRRDVPVLLALLSLGPLLRLQDSGTIAATLVLVAVVLATISPLAGVLGGIVALPFAYETVELAGMRFSFLELAVVTAVAGTSHSVLVSLADAAGRVRMRSVLRPWWLPATAIGVVVAGTVSCLFVGRSHFDENLRVYRWTILEPVAFWFACRWTLRGDAERRLAAAVLVVVGAVIGALAVGEAVLGTGGVADGAVSRPQLAYPHPNNLAFFLERASVVAVGIVMAVGRRSWWTAAACLALGGAAATFSRGAYLAVLLGVVWLVGGTSRRGWAMIAGTILGMMSLVLLWLGGRLLDAGGTGDAPTRLPIWRSSVRMILDHPVSGVGLDGFLYEYWRRYVEPIGWAERYTSHPHNLILDVWLRLGILGVLALATVVLAVALAARWDRSLRTGPLPLASASMAALVAGFGHGLVDNGYFLPDLAIMTWLLIALSAGSATGAPSDSP